VFLPDFAKRPESTWERMGTRPVRPVSALATSLQMWLEICALLERDPSAKMDTRLGATEEWGRWVGWIDKRLATGN